MSDSGAARAASRSVSHSRHLHAPLSAHYSLIFLCFWENSQPPSRWSPALFLCKVRMTTRPARSAFTISDPSTPLSFHPPIDFSSEVAWPIAAMYHLECATPSLERERERAREQRVGPRCGSGHGQGQLTHSRTDGQTDALAAVPAAAPPPPRRAYSRVESLSATGCSPPPPQSPSLSLPLSVRKNLLHRSQDRKRESGRGRRRYGRSAVFTSEAE